MDNASTDVHKVLTFGREKLARKMLLFALVGGVVGLLSTRSGPYKKR